MMVEENYLCKFRKIDALRLYGGDTRERNSDGGIGGNSKDPMYGDKDAYRTLNALLFEGVGNEQERIWVEGHKLNPDFIKRIEETVQIYTDIFTLMKEEKEDFTDSVAGKRIDRASSVMYYENGVTQSFFSSSKRGYDSEFAKKNGIVLIETKIISNVPFIDYEKILTQKEYKNWEEREILLPPFLNIEMEKVSLTKAETKKVKDLNKKPPLGKYRLTTIEFPDYRKRISDSERVLWQQIMQGKETAAGLLEKMNEGDKTQDYKEYLFWKQKLQIYLKILFSQIWYGGGEG
ncbi:hypothetical protein IMSAGC002_00648 [Lachnospiraceae bacterium]|nr:hypothetical protein IMSAGC002_00648 [Lachnospiraceae bacterium]